MRNPAKPREYRDTPQTIADETRHDRNRFKALAAQGYNRIPLVAETYADLDTPLGIYLKLAHAGPQAGRMTCLMESVVGGGASAAIRSSACRRAR